jgi:peptide/nickel transport system ATP-binding protein
VADSADRIAVMHAGEIVEQGTPERIFADPEHPYTRDLLQALRPAKRRHAHTRNAPLPVLQPASAGHPGAASPPSPPHAGTLLEVDDLRVTYAGRGRRTARIEAVRGVSLTVVAGETLAIVGESGCGKTTLLRSIARLVEPTGGAIRLDGEDLASASRRELAALRRGLGMVFQDPQASLNPRRRVGDTLERALRACAGARGAHRLEDPAAPGVGPYRGVDGSASRRGAPHGGGQTTDARVEATRLLERVGLTAAHGKRFPHELSGGQRQRVGIARALVGEPRLVLLDEPVSSLDASIRREIVELLDELQAQLGCGYVLVSHDLAMVEAVADRIAVMYAGEIVELADARDLLERPTHPYTRTLLAASPRLPGCVRSSRWADTQTTRDGLPRVKTPRQGSGDPSAQEIPPPPISPRTPYGSFSA